MDFNFDSIKPNVDVTCTTYEGVNKAILEFSNIELFEQMVGYLMPQSFLANIAPYSKDAIGIQIKESYDTLQILERICTTLELHDKKVSRKYISSGKSDGKSVDSYMMVR